jgi:hypothetical protein
METNAWFRLVISVLAVWRITHLLAAEDGPWDLIVRIRRKLGNSGVGRLVDCFYCLSMWISIPFTFFLADRTLTRLIAWLALSGAACLAERMGAAPWSGAPVVFEEPGKRDH